jgi:hypothetical protein
VHGTHTPDANWGREESVAFVIEFEDALPKGTSQRRFADESRVPRTTLQYWVERKRTLAASGLPPTVIAFFESPEGLALLHRLVLAIQFVVSLIIGAGCRPVAEIIRLAGLEPFVANSVGIRVKSADEMLDEIRAFERNQRPKLVEKMTPQTISVAEDETFHPQICMVGIEPVSNFIVLEEYSDKRDAETWDAKMGKALADLPVRVIQSVSDEGKGLVGHVQNGLGAHHSPDVFHVQHEASKATAIVLASQVKQAEEDLAKAAAETAQQKAEAHAWDEAERHDPGRPPNFDARIAAAQDAEADAQKIRDEARERQEGARCATRGIGEAYHPVDLRTGELRSTEKVAEELQEHFNEIQTVADEAELPERCHKGIKKARRVLAQLVNTMAFFHAEVERRIRDHHLTPQEAKVFRNALLPAAYLERAAKKTKTADVRTGVRRLAEQRWAEAHESLNLPCAADPERRAILERLADTCATLFQRASSCVEGRNGQLSLRHHSLHSLSPERLEALTIVHNYYIRRPDETTAAERFFGTKPDDLFEWLVAHLDPPARPAKQRGPHDRLLN